MKVQNKFRNKKKSWDKTRGTEICTVPGTLRGTKQEKGISRARNRIRTVLSNTRRETEIT